MAGVMSLDWCITDEVHGHGLYMQGGTADGEGKLNTQ